MQIIVLGMHRSGTSTVARILNLLGIYFGPEGISTGSNDENIKGFWERKDVRQLNDFVLQQNSHDWYKISGLNSKNPFSKESVEEFHEKAKKLILEMDAHRPWFIKEPRLCLTRELWEKHLEVPIYIYVHRTPIEVALSLGKRNSFPLDFGLDLWYEYNLRAMSGLPKEGTHFINYNELMKDPLLVSKKLSNFLQQKGVPVRALNENELKKFVDPSLYRQQSTDNKLLNDAQKKMSDFLNKGKSPKDLKSIVDKSFQNHEMNFDKVFRFQQLENRINELLKQNTFVSEKLEKYIATVNEKNNNINSLKEDLAEVREVSKKRGVELQKRNERVEHLENEIRKREDIIRQKDDKIRLKEDGIRKKEDEVRIEKANYRSIKIEILGIQNELKIREQIINELKKNIELEKERVRREKDNSKTQQNRIKEELTNKIKSLHSIIAAKDKLIVDYWNEIQNSRIKNRIRKVIGMEAKGLAAYPIPKPQKKEPLSKQEKKPEPPRVTTVIKKEQEIEYTIDGINQELQQNKTSIIIPIFNAHDDVKKCIDSVLETVNDRSVIAIDDGSTDERMLPMLKEYQAKFNNFKLIINEINLGYTRSINKAINSCDTDIVLVNSDTIVTDNWLDFLEESAYVDNKVGTVTAISNNAGAFSVPKVNEPNDLPEGLSLNEYAYIVRKLSNGKLHKVPTGSGFIFYVKRKLFQSIGFFDEFNFPRGYGEENDFCQRVINRGLLNIIDPRVFIYHKRSASFKEEKKKLIENAKTKLSRIHPTYQSQVKNFIQNHPLKGLAEELNAYDFSTFDKKSMYDDSKINILYIIHDGGGGSIHTNKDLVEGLEGEYNRFILLCGVSKWKLYDAQDDQIVREVEFENRWKAINPCGHERLLVLGIICRDYNIDITHFRSIIAIGPEALLHVKNMGLKVIFSLHDFIIICPTIQLVDNNNKYCGGVCTAGEGDCKIAKGWFGEIPNLKHDFVYNWRTKIQKYLVYPDVLITTSKYSKDLFLKHYPILSNEDIKLIEHGRDLSIKRDISKSPSQNPIKVAVFGAMNIAKGTILLTDIFALNQEHKESGNNTFFEFHVFGNVISEFEKTKEMDGVIHHGPYERDELYDLIKDVGPSFAMVSSIWPETYCHTLTESWLMGLPVFASDIGTIKERIEEHGGGWLLDYQSAENWYESMLSIAKNSEEYTKKLDEVAKVTIKEKSKMVGEYAEVYQELIKQ